jgi:cysteine desulfurase
MGLTRALELFSNPPVFPRDPLQELTRRLAVAAEEAPGVSVWGNQTKRLANTVSFSVEGTDSIALMAGFDLEGVCASSGSACSAGSIEPSHVILALGAEPKLANSLVRFSLGRESTRPEVDAVIAMLPMVIARARTR